MSNEIDIRLLALSNLLQVEVEARHAESLRDLFFVMANDTHRVVAYRQAFVWELPEIGAPNVVQASNVSEVDRNAPIVRWFNDMAAWLATRQDQKPELIGESDVPAELQAGWREFSAPYGLTIPLRAPGGRQLGGLFLAADAPWNEAWVMLLERLGDAYAHAWKGLQPRPVQQLVRRHMQRYWRRYAAGAAVLLLLPLRQYVLVPAEVVPIDPFVIAAPMNGVVETVEINPNEMVDAGKLLFTLEDTGLTNELLVAQKAYEVAEAEYLKNAQKAFQCDICRGKVPEMQAALEKEAARVEWAREQLDRSRVAAPASGIAVFNDPNEWRGRPVSVGERVMLLAEPDKTRLRITLPIADAIAIDAGTDVVFYLNISPLDSYDAQVARTSYEATVQPDNTLAYVLLADFTDEKARLGLRGTAKVYGARAPLVFHILRRPLSWLRRTLGV